MRPAAAGRKRNQSIPHLGYFLCHNNLMSTDKTALGDLKILLAIILCASLIWGFFKIKSKASSPSRSAPASQVNQK